MFPEPEGELRSPIRYDRFRQPVVAEDPITEEFDQPFSCNSCCAGEEVPLFRQAVHKHTDGTISFRWGQACNEVDRNMLPGLCWYRQGT